MAEEIVNEICDIKGERLSEISKTFTLLVNSKHEIIKENINDILAKFSPKNYLEKHLRLRLIDIFKQTKEVDCILKSSDSFSINRALKFKWYFKDINNCHSLVNETMPLISYCSRVKVVKQFSNNLSCQETAEKLFEAIKQRYDLSLALTLLPACSEKFVSTIIPTLRVKLQIDIFSKLLNCYPDLMTEYLETILEGVHENKRAFRNSFSSYQYEPIFKKLASKNPVMFLKLCKKYEYDIPYMSLGRSTTKRLLRTNFPEICKNFSAYSRVLPTEYVRQYLSTDQIELLQLSEFPKSLTNFFGACEYDTYLELVQHLPKDQRIRITMTNFEKKFGRPVTLEEFSDVISIECAKILPDDIRCKWIETKIPTLESVYDKARYTTYLPISVSFPRLKQLMENQGEVVVRAFIIARMIKSIKYHADIDSLVDVVNFVLKRYRNDNIELRKKLFSEIQDLGKLLRHMKVEDFSCIKELIKLVKLYKENDDHRICIIKILHELIKNFFQKGLPMEDHLKYFFETEKYLYGLGSFDLCKNTTYEKSCLLFFLTRISKEKEIESVKQLFEQICDYNSKHKKDKIEIPEWMMTAITDFIITKSTNFDYEDKTLVVDNSKKDFTVKEKMFTEIFPAYIAPSVLLFTLKRNPTKILDHLDETMSTLFKHFNNKYCSFFRLAKLYPQLCLPEKIVKLCINKLNEDIDSNEDEHEEKPTAVIILSFLAESDVYIETIHKFYPTTSIIDYNEENDCLYRIQQAIASSLKHLNDPTNALTPLKKLAVGDYLKYIVGSINSICSQVPEEKILPLLKEWMDSPVSVRKHFVRLFNKIAPKMMKIQFLKDNFPIEENGSMRLVLFQHALKFFLHDPSEESFEVFKFVVDNLKEKDDRTLDKMFNIDRIPDEFVSRYVESLWKLVSLKEPALSEKIRKKIIDSMDSEVLKLLSEKFCENVLNELFSIERLESYNSLDFVVHYLLYCNDNETQLARLDKTMFHLIPLVKNQWNKYNVLKENVFPVRNAVTRLVNEFCNETTNKIKSLMNPSSMLKQFQTELKNIIDEELILNHLIQIDYTIVFAEYYAAKGSKPDPDCLVDFTKASLEKYSNITSAILIDTIFSATGFRELEGEEEEREKGYLSVCEKLLSDSLESCNLIGLKLVYNGIYDEYRVPQYKNILKLILENPHSSVKVLSSTTLANMSSSVTVV